MSPVLSSIGLGLWHSVCSSVGAAMMLRTSVQNGFPDMSPEEQVCNRALNATIFSIISIH